MRQPRASRQRHRTPEQLAAAAAERTARAAMREQARKERLQARAARHEVRLDVGALAPLDTPYSPDLPQRLVDWARAEVSADRCPLPGTWATSLGLPLSVVVGWGAEHPDMGAAIEVAQQIVESYLVHKGMLGEGKTIVPKALQHLCAWTDKADVDVTHHGDISFRMILPPEEGDACP